MKKVLIDLEKIKYQNNGFGQFSLNLGLSIAPLFHDGNTGLDILIPRTREHLFKSPGTNLTFTSPFKKEGFQKMLRPFLGSLARKQYDLWHSTTQKAHYLPLHRKTPLILTIHDLNILRSLGEPERTKQLNKIQKLVNRANVITTISHFSAQDISQHLDLQGKPLVVIHNGVSVSPSTCTIRPEFLPEGKFLFTIGQFLEKKNFHVLIPMLKYIPDLTLVIAGDNNSDYALEIEAIIKGYELENRVICPGMIDEEQKSYLYQHCEAFVFPSLTEGFGLPVIEAMRYGKPVFISNNTSLPEIGGNKAFYWNHYDPKYMSDVFERGMEIYNADPSYADKLKKHSLQFNWETAAAKYQALYQNVLSGQYA